MERLTSSARLMIVSDLDHTMVDHHDPENLSLLRFNSLWEDAYRHDSLLVFSTGRSPTLYKELRKEKPLLTPDITIMSVGTEITFGNSMVPDDGWVQTLNAKWDLGIVKEESSKFSELTLQSETEQRPHKVSFYVDKTKAQAVTKELSQRLEKRGLDVKIIYSGGMDLDILPQGAGKGQALAYLLKKLKTEGKLPVNTLACGDSGNDAELFSIPDVYGVMVSNAQEELLKWHAENAKDNSKVIHATERCAAGIIQAIGHFKLGPNLSPRDVADFLECKADNVNPGHEVVKFFLFYERWRRGEVENCETYTASLKASCHPGGVFVHPSGTEKSLRDTIDELRKYHGDKQGKKFRVWADQVLATNTTTGTWIVKLDKWEQSGNERRCCTATVKFTAKEGEGEGFVWEHVEQKWSDKSEKGWEFGSVAVSMAEEQWVVMVTAQTPTNIAVIKYWGKRDEARILPINDSISITLDPDHLCTLTTVAVSPAFDRDRMWLNGKEISLSGSRYQNCLREIRSRAADVEDKTKGIKIAKKDWEKLHLHIASYNNFPTAAGLASSAAGFACLVFALAKLMNVDEDPGQLSAIARQGSGSACRSLFGGFVKWNMGTKEDGSDSIAVQVADDKHWKDLVIIIAVVSSRQKEMSSTAGMRESVETSLLLDHRAKEVVPVRIVEMEEAIKKRDFTSFTRLTCSDSNQFHAVCMDTSPPIFYMNDTSHRIISLVEKWNRSAGTPEVAYTFDAGPNAVLIARNRKVAVELLQGLLYCFPPKPGQDMKSYVVGDTSIACEAALGRDSEIPHEIKEKVGIEGEKGEVSYFICSRAGRGPVVLQDQSQALLNPQTGLPK